MTQAAHTPGPWSTDTDRLKDGQAFCNVYGAGREPVAYLTLLPDEVEANAARIVACVNALEGIADPSVVGEAIEALGQIKLIVEDTGYCVRADTPMTPFIAVLNEVYETAEVVLANLEGKAS